MKAFLSFAGRWVLILGCVFLLACKASQKAPDPSSKDSPPSTSKASGKSDDIPYPEAMMRLGKVSMAIGANSYNGSPKLRAAWAELDGIQQKMDPPLRMELSRGKVTRDWYPEADAFTGRHMKKIQDYLRTLREMNAAGRLTTVARKDVEFYEAVVPRYAEAVGQMVEQISRQMNVLKDGSLRYQGMVVRGMSDDAYHAVNVQLRQIRDQAAAFTPAILEIAKRDLFQVKAPDACAFKPREGTPSLVEEYSTDLDGVKSQVQGL